MPRIIIIRTCRSQRRAWHFAIVIVARLYQLQTMSQHPSRSALGSGTDSGGGADAEGGSVPSSLGAVVRDTRAASSLSGLSSASRNGTLQASPPAIGTNHSINHPMAQMGSAFQAGPLVPYGPMMPMPSHQKVRAKARNRHHCRKTPSSSDMTRKIGKSFSRSTMVG